MAKKTQTKTNEVIPVNTKAKDTFFKKVYEKEERQRALAAFLLGISSEKISTATVRPVLFGNKENDFACMCDDVVYILTEEQSSGSPNLPYRLLEYATTGLRSMVDSEQLLYGRKRVYFPIPKLYVLQVGLEAKAANLPEQVQYDIRLSDSFLSAAEKYGENAPAPDLEAVVHVYDFTISKMLSCLTALQPMTMTCGIMRWWQTGLPICSDADTMTNIQCPQTYQQLRSF